MQSETASVVFAHRLAAVREATGMSQAQLAARLERIGYPLKRGAIKDIERGNRRVTLDDWLAISSALGVAPIHMVVPFERSELLDEPATIKDTKTGGTKTETPADLGIFEPETELRVTGKDADERGPEIPGVVLVPADARAWIRGVRPHADAEPSLKQRFYYDQVPPPRRHQLDDIVAAVREGREPKVRLLVEERPSSTPTSWNAEALKLISDPILAAYIAEGFKEEDTDATSR